MAGEGSSENAAAFIERVEEACLSLQMFPERGTRRDDIRPRLRIMDFERRVTIAFQVGRTEVVIVRIPYAGQDYKRAFHR